MKYFLDLFSGIGGFHLGAQWAGLHFDGYYYSEVDPYAIKVYAKRFPSAIGLGDIAKIDGHALPKGDWIIAGGFPCQDISVAGKGAGLAGERSGLWFEYARLIGELRPRYAIMENVGALTFRGLDRVLGSLAEIGYDAEWQDIRASDVGAPHRRERIWIVAYPELHGRATCEERGSTKEAIRQEQTGEGKSLDFTGSGSISAAEGNVAYPNDSIRRPVGRSVEGCDSESRRETPSRRIREGMRNPIDGGFTTSGKYAPDVPDPNEIMRDRSGGTRDRGIESTDSRQIVADASDGGDVRRDGELEPAQGQVREHRGSPEDGSGEWWAAEPALGCVVDGLPAGLDRFEGRVCNKMPERVNQLKCLGNSIVPQIAQMIFEQPALGRWRHR